MPVVNTLTLENLRDIARQLKEAQTAEDVRSIFQNNYKSCGWKRMGQLFALNYDADTMFLADQDKLARLEARYDSNDG